MDMKKIIFSFFCVLVLVSNVTATHLVGVDGEITLNDTSNSQYWKYQLDLRLVSDVSSNLTQFDKTIEVAVYDAVNKNLVVKLPVPLENESNAINGIYQYGQYKIGTYSAHFTLEKSSNGYIIQYRRCCIPTSININDGQGLELTIPISPDLKPAVKTSETRRGPIVLVTSQKQLVIQSPWHFPNADSVKIESAGYYTGGTDLDPIPTFPNTYISSKSGVFNNGYQAGSPFGADGSISILNMDSIEININRTGKFFLPLTYKVYYGSKEVVHNRLVYLVSLLSNQKDRLKLGLQSMDSSQILLNSISLGFTNVDTFVLQRSVGSQSTNFIDYQFDLARTDWQYLSDSNISKKNYYQYRTKLVSQGVSYYSNIVTVNYGLVSIAKISSLNPKLYPNPARSIVNMDVLKLSNYQVLDFYGKVLRNGTVSPENSKIALEDLPSGTYYIKIDNQIFKLVHSE